MSAKHKKKNLVELIKDKLEMAWIFIRREKIDQIISFFCIVVFISAVLIYLAENNNPDKPLGFPDALWWSIVTSTTVGYGDIAPQTFLGRVIATLHMIVGIGILAALSAIPASILVDQKIMEGLGMSSYKFEKHIIICEWNHRAKTIIKELRLDPHTANTPIVLIANLERKPIEDRNLYFVQGSITDETLSKANLAQAATVIILGDDNLPDNQRDTQVIITTLTVESINPDAYTIVELVHESYVLPCKRANADEIIVSSELSGMLISQAALNHGVSHVVADLISADDEGNQLYKIEPIKERVGSPFIEIFVYMKKAYQCIVVAIQKGPEGEVISNPSTEYRLEENDYLIVIAEERPNMII
ncbi:K+ transport system, NAD-binding component [Xenococcus sp. PCC 7305]|uniref:potassium channel family protein n=1 Tax=Xenococcus sp. PCC 7305 TaxID=102125 RepID=UPI0002ABE7FD|nr:potassium channel family protein [Xenococcus sp. PCC 7305]ELS04884.1 K+ transport system, NAD-binding component [Xenococcus sp. PCC 7305]